MMLAAVLMLAQAAAPAPQPATTVTVVGTTIEALQSALKDCIARGCSPRDDVIASARLAEGQFRTGRVQDARRTLEQAIVRDRHAAKDDPVAVAGLYEATATVAQHDGEQRLVRSATYDRARILRENLPAGSTEALYADLDVANFEYRYEGSVRSRDLYQDLAKRAEAAGKPTIAALAILHVATVAHNAHEEDRARRLLAGVSADTRLPAAYRLAAQATEARFERERGHKGATDALIAGLAGAPQGALPVLVWQPPIPDVADVANINAFNTVDSHTGSGYQIGLDWVDVGFWIDAGGKVENAEILRSSRGESWGKDIVKLIGARRYAPLGPDGGQYRVERWTLTADWGTPNGSLIRRRVFNPHYEQLDLTGEPPKTPAPAKAG